MEIRKKSDLYYASDEEIEDFFRNSVFRGLYSKLPQENEDKRFCGKIEHITINGITNDLCPVTLYVPSKFERFLKPGHCEFIALLNTSVFRQDRHQYKLIILRIKNIEQVKVTRDRLAELKFRYNLKLKDDKFVGLFTENKDGSFTIRDIRRSDFSKLILQNGKEQAPIVYHPHLFKPKDGAYYEFSWVLNGEKENYVYLFKVDETQSFQEVSPRNLIQRLHDDIMNYPPGAGQKIVKMLDTLKNQLTASGKEIFIYELLQNANDYPVTINNVKQKVDVEFHLTLSSLVFMHSGAVFNERNIAAICSINDKEKDTNKDTIGYKGIGFKTVFLDNENVYLQTGDYSFRFDRQATKDIVDTPWQILPIWTKYQELTTAERAIFTQAGEEFRVKFALRPTKLETLRGSEHNYEDMFHEIFKNERVILFIPNLSSVKVYLKGRPIPDIICSRDNDNWRVDDFNENIDEDITKAINADIDEQEDTGGLKIPTKYYNFKNTKVSFACEIEGRKLKAVKDTCLYCYLPAKDATWGLKFLMNTDMVPNGARDDVEVDFSNSTNVNETIANIAGSKLFEWILKLSKSGEYELDSIYDLIPNFASLKSGRLKYKELINSFENGFVNRVETDKLVPSQDSYICLLDAVVDETGISSSGIMTDEEFLKFSNNASKSLPVSELRSSKSFQSFAELYLRKFDVEDSIFDIDSLHKMIGEPDFQEWLKDQDNNNKFLNFLLENDYLRDLLVEKIFIEEECVDLYSAEDLFYNIDEDLKDLSAFSNHLYYLSLKTREFFEGNKKWDEVIEGKFAEFDGDDFIKNTLLSENWDETVKALADWETSFHFYRYIANNNILPDELNDLPFFNDEETAELIDDFNDKFVFLSSEEGETLFNNASWLSSVPFAFISVKYGEDTLDYFKDNIKEVRDFLHDIIVQHIIQSADYQKDINNLQQEDIESSIDFVKYCYEHKELFDNGSLCNYALNASDCDGEEDFVLHENHIFFPSSCFDLYSEKEWINADWMYCLNSEYLAISTDKSDVKKFLKDIFYVNELDEKMFYEEVVRNNIPTIIDNTSGTNDSDGKKNLDFVSYLDGNYKLIFEDKKDAELFAAFIFISDNEDGTYSDIESDSTYIYVYDTELKEILDSDWFPTDTVYMCSHNYGNSRAITSIKASRYEFSKFFDDVITEELSNINDTIDSKEASIAFHSFIIERLRSLTDPQKEVMKDAKVYLYGSDEPCDSSVGHKILSKSARELSSMGLVEFADLDIIDPDYNIEENEDYWKNRLGNEQFTVTDFVKWLDENTDTFYTTIKDKENNIKFWRWLKGCKLADKTLADLPVLPIYLNNGKYVNSDDTIYLSDNYILDGGIETIVRNYNKYAVFVCAKYIKEGDDIETWKNFWSKLGVRFEMVDILIDTIDNRLNETEDEKLPATIAKYRTKLDEHYDGELISKLTNLRVKANDNSFYNLNEILYINCEKEEPFRFIELPNQANFATADERKLIIDIIEEVGGEKIDRLTEWQAAKINRYIEIQNDLDLDELLRSIHFKFVDELATMYNNDRDFLKQFENVTEVLLLDSDEEFCVAEELTLGSIYNPLCDFEKFELEYHYLSKSYKSECSNDIRKMLNRIFKIHCDFKKNDIKQLTNRDFSIYFWSQYLIKKDADISGIKNLIEDGEFNSFECIPTKDYMKSPKELYYGDDVSKYVKYIEDWENKIPLKDLPEVTQNDGSTIFSKLPFKDSLDFLDGLYALIYVLGQDRRTQILEWMIDNYDESYDEKISEYREDEHALWYNNKNEQIHIKELYALNYWEKTLDQYFGNNPRIINKAYFPVGDSFKDACDILGIKTISLCDLKMEPQGDTVFTQRSNDLKLFALAIAGMIDPESWRDLYDGYVEQLKLLVLHRCKSIMISYKEDESINQSLRKFYHEEGSNDFYFVDSLDGKRVYTLFVKEFTEYLGINEDDIPQEMIEDIMDSRENALDVIREQNRLLLDENFKDTLNDLIPGIKRELNGNKANDDDDNEPTTYQPTFTTDESQKDEDDGSKDDYNIEESDGDKYDNDSTPCDSLDEDKEMSSSSTYDSERSVSEREPRSDKGDTHNYPQSHHQSEQTGTGQRQKKPYHNGEKVEDSYRPYTNHNGWDDTSRSQTPLQPKPFSPEDVRNFGSRGVTRTLDVLEPMQSEVDEINRILGEDLSPEQVADQNYLAQLRLYNNLVKREMVPDETKEDFIRNGHLKNEHTIGDGKYIHKCSAAGGIMYLSPSIWNKIADDKCVVCVYLGAKSNEFMYFNTLEDILTWIGEDDIIIKLTGEEKADVVTELYSGVLNGVKGTAYTLIRINSNEKYNSLFAQLPTNDINGQEENEDEY